MRIDQDFGVIEAAGAEIPRGLLRELANQDDVVSISVDAEVSSMQSTPTPGATFTVTSTSNSGAGTLRQAILDANARAGYDAIVFNIAVKTISPSSALPGIASPVLIDGWSQPGFAGSPRIELNGSNAGSGSESLTFWAGSQGSTVRGLTINRFKGHGIEAWSVNSLTFHGNWIGLSNTGLAASANKVTGIYLGTGSGHVIGGTGANERNVISGNTERGIVLDGVHGSTVLGNYVGTSIDGTGDVNGSVQNHLQSGIVLWGGSSNNIIGGTTAAARNLLSGNSGHGVYLGNDATGAVIQGNVIGMDAGRTAFLANTWEGVCIDQASNTLVGGTAFGAGNTIAGNGGAGVAVNVGTGNVVLGNSSFGNGGLGVDLAASTSWGPTANDTLDADTGSNNLQNHPVLTSAVTTGNVVDVTGTMNSSALTYFRVELFASTSLNASGHGDGNTYLGAVNVMTNAAGTTTFRAVLPAAVAVSSVVSATATKTNSTYATFVETSEFAPPVTAWQAPYTLRATLGVDTATASTAVTTRTGSGVTVAVIDSGMLLDGGPASRIKTTRDFTGGSTNPSHVAALDPHGHGTHVAGLIGSDQADYRGVATGVSYVSLRVLNSLGAGTTSHVINAIQWAVANKATYGIDVINLSLGHPIYEPAATDPLVQAVEAAVRAGIVVVTSAGNYGVNPLTGLFQLRLLEGRDGVAEWGFILGAAYWGTGLFVSGAQQVVDFAFDVVGLHRLEARAAVKNGRGNGALMKLGAVREARLRESFERYGERLDQHLWSIARDDWRAARAPRVDVVRVH